jgi:hypothetical protein
MKRDSILIVVTFLLMVPIIMHGVQDLFGALIIATLIITPLLACLILPLHRAWMWILRRWPPVAVSLLVPVITIIAVAHYEIWIKDTLQRHRSARVLIDPFEDEAQYKQSKFIPLDPEDGNKPQFTYLDEEPPKSAVTFLDEEETKRGVTFLDEKPAVSTNADYEDGQVLRNVWVPDRLRSEVVVYPDNVASALWDSVLTAPRPGRTH